MKKLIAVLLLMTILQGCSLSVSGGVATDWFYPDVRTKTGGGFGDPATSRHEVTRATTSHVRNNDGNSTDKALRAFFGTERAAKQAFTVAPADGSAGVFLYIYLFFNISA